MSEVATIIIKSNVEEIKPEVLAVEVLEKLKLKDYGIKFEYFKIMNFAIVKTFRLIQDYSWVQEGLDMNKTK